MTKNREQGTSARPATSVRLAWRHRFFDAVFTDGRDNGPAMTRILDAVETSNLIRRDALENAPNRFDCG
jgi:hypothetical protein